jgi:hypothetical protein
VTWLHLRALPKPVLLPRGWVASVVPLGRTSAVSLALAFLDGRGDFPPNVLSHRARPQITTQSTPARGMRLGVW